ncbi:MAG: efflux RND transporter periplasmic adaptor subunit [Woeseiaceae bacterium]|nr:efflux RND transporter periplasmic adaptor subunit [Woeseiaceae bacterium]
MLIARILILSLCAAATFAFAQGGFPTTVETVQVTTSTMQASVRAVGTLIAEAAAVLRAEVPGQVLEVHFAEGQRVRKGDRLFSIEATVLEAEVNEARANAERSTAAFERAREMYAKKLISANDYDAAQANMNVDVARLLSSQAKLSKTTIRAPFDGYVGLREINIGDYATVGQAVVDVVQLDPLRVEFSVPETLLPKISAGQAISVSVDAYPGETFDGTITAVSPRIDVAGHSVATRASLPNPSLKLRPGFFVRVNVTLAEKADALLVPEEAIWPIGQDKTVYVVIDGKVHQRKVILGERLPGQVEILSGLEVGETIVVAGQMKLFEGAAVQTQDVASAAGS